MSADDLSRSANIAELQREFPRPRVLKRSCSVSIIDLLWKLARGTDVTLNMYDPALPLKIQYKQWDTSANTADRGGAEASSCCQSLNYLFYLCLYINPKITGMCSSRNIVPVIIYLLSIKLYDESCTDYHVVIETVATMIAVCQHTAFSGIHTSCATMCHSELRTRICARLILSVVRTVLRKSKTEPVKTQFVLLCRVW